MTFSRWSDTEKITERVSKMRTSVFGRIIQWILILSVLSALMGPAPEPSGAEAAASSASGLMQNIIEPLIRNLCSEEARAWCLSVLELLLDCILLVLEFLIEVLKRSLNALLTG